MVGGGGMDRLWKVRYPRGGRGDCEGEVVMKERLELRSSSIRARERREKRECRQMTMNAAALWPPCPRFGRIPTARDAVAHNASSPHRRFLATVPPLL